LTYTKNENNFIDIGLTSGLDLKHDMSVHFYYLIILKSEFPLAKTGFLDIYSWVIMDIEGLIISC